MARGHFLGRWRQFRLAISTLAWRSWPGVLHRLAVPATWAWSAEFYWAWSAAFLGARLMACSWSAGSQPRGSLIQFLEDLQATHSRLVTRCARPQSPSGLEVVVLTDKSISFLVLQRVLQQALKTLKLNAATSDFSVINYEEAKFVITLKDGRKYTVTIAPVE
jgi:hypothetical protein